VLFGSGCKLQSPAPAMHRPKIFAPSRRRTYFPGRPRCHCAFHLPPRPRVPVIAGDKGYIAAANRAAPPVPTLVPTRGIRRPDPADAAVTRGPPVPVASPNLPCHKTPAQFSSDNDQHVPILSPPRTRATPLRDSPRARPCRQRPLPFLPYP
jgi:hypothetical protein